MVTDPREESKRLQICMPPLEIVTFTVAFEEGMVLMTSLDVSIMRDEYDNRYGLQELHTSKCKKYLRWNVPCPRSRTSGRYRVVGTR